MQYIVENEKVILTVDTHAAEIHSFKRKDDVLTALIHLGYLAYDTETAIDQIKIKHYTDSLQGYVGEVVLVGINYNKNIDEGKKHSCKIERIIL